MRAEIQEPVVTERNDPMGGVMVNHPAFGQIGASRVSGHASLYGSDFQHQHYVTITISRSQLTRSLSNDFVFAGKELIEVALSEAQWAQFVSSMNVGGGTQCTLQHIAMEGVPGLPPPVSRKDQFKGEVREDMRQALQQLEELAAAIKETGLSDKKAKALLGRVASARQSLVDNVPFVLDQFAEHVENTVEHAKIEINAYMTNAVQRAGLEALGVEAKSILSLEVSKP